VALPGCILSSSPSDYIFKACGTAEYFAGNYKLIDFTYIRNALLKGSEIHLTLVLLSEALPDAIEQTVDQHKEDVCWCRTGTAGLSTPPLTLVVAATPRIGSCG